MPLSEVEIQRVATGWVHFHQAPEHSEGRQESFWAYRDLCDFAQEDPEVAWSAIDAIRRLDGSDLILSNLAAGPVENLLVYHGSSFIDRVESLAKDDLQFRKILGAVWQRDMNEDIWARVKAIAAPTW